MRSTRTLAASLVCALTLAATASPVAAQTANRSPARGADAVTTTTSTVVSPSPERTGSLAPAPTPGPADDPTPTRTPQRGGSPGGLAVAPSAGNDDCFVDFDDDLVLQFIPDHAQYGILGYDWNQACFAGDYYPAVSVQSPDHGHFHLPYADDRIGPCDGDPNTWGRKADPAPTTDDAYNDWLFEPCAEAIDPITEPRRGIRPHWADAEALIFAYDGDGHLPFRLNRLKVTEGQVEVCHLPPGPWEANGPDDGPPQQCITLGAGTWDLSGHVDEAIEVTVRFLVGDSEIDDIGIDLL